MGNISREMETLRKNQKEMLEIKNTVTNQETRHRGKKVEYQKIFNESKGRQKKRSGSKIQWNK